MKRFLITVVATYIFIGCSTEADVESAKERTFIRYYGTAQNDVGVLAQEDANGGFALLSTSEIETGVTGQIKYNIHFTQLDQWGNHVWDRTYLTDLNTTASSFVQTPSGYYVIGDRINNDDHSDLQILHINEETGDLIAETTISLTTRSLHGRAITYDGTNFFILGAIDPNSESLNNMLVAKVSPSDLSSPVWTREYGDGPANLINRLYTVGSTENLWGGSVEFSNASDFKLVQAYQDSEAPYINNNIGDPTFDENPLDFCKGFTGWVVTGYSNKNFGNVNIENTEDIYIQKIWDNGTNGFYTQLPGVDDPNDVDTRNERGNSICLIEEDHSYVVLGTVETVDQKEDLMITKINDSGVEVWDRKYFGGSDKQEGASVRKNSDGSILIFGTTYFGTEKKLILIKVDKDGNL
jgi:hypothetical protein